ncbi:hypothetical protein MTBPR1_10515 [Candidatus Terasakiella magnetica]|uniref:Suppressor protein SRP40 n=2 Tax=Candidatus Terasakiella magnetica TaxID=1867952 RepID=A0A1C3RDE6_9PROT|nr:hypothetical protein MTBPR1_10515 [Candidatus Terasakiella magnetica]
MSISSIAPPSPQSYLISELQDNGLSSEQAKNTASEIGSIVESSQGQSPIAVRESINAEIASDVASGELTQEEADIITASLDELEEQAQSAPPPPPPSGGASKGSSGGGAGGGESSSSSTEVVDVETSTTESGWTTKTTTYSDDTETTTVTYDASKDKTKTEPSETSSLGAIQSLLKENDATDATLNYVTDLMSKGRLNVFA